ncbi:MAG TPA: DKNYY domain-containing protein [Burkholderiaceae bacterium]|nr:DKNYY domain-containing protein [Burkholderiaceae bacterium]
MTARQLPAVIRLLCVAFLFCLLGGCKGEAPFAQKDGVWHYRTATIAQSDAASFRILSDHYAKDRTYVYYGDSYRDGREYYMISHDRVRVVKEADPATFQYLDQDYARDARAVFYEGERFAVKDVASFQVLNYGFAKDTQTGYYLRTPIAGSDGASFTELGDGHHARDKARAYYCDYASSRVEKGPGVRTTVLRGADPATLVALELGYAKTPTTVYYRGQPVAGADAPSFETPGGLAEGVDAKDKNAVYQQGRKRAAPAP